MKEKDVAGFGSCYVFSGIVHRKEYNPFENITRVHLGAKLKLGCNFESLSV